MNAKPTCATDLRREINQYQAEQKRIGGPGLHPSVLAALSLIEDFEAIDLFWQREKERLRLRSRWLRHQAERRQVKTRPLCGAATRAGGACRARCVPGRSRCRLHGGCSTGPKTEAGRAAIIASNKRRAKEKRARVAALMKQSRNADSKAA